jgi:hypothetical protein
MKDQAAMPDDPRPIRTVLLVEDDPKDTECSKRAFKIPVMSWRCQARMVLTVATVTDSPRRFQPMAAPYSANRRLQATVTCFRGRGVISL